AVLSYRSILHIHLLSFHLHFSFSCASDLLHLHSFPTRRSSDLVLRHYGFTPIYTKPHKADLISTGSILERISEDYQGIVLGSGFINEGSNPVMKNAQFLSVRGKLSKNKLDLNDEVLYGDPGLIAAKLLKKREMKRYKLGIVPHWIDRNDEFVKNIKSRNNNEITIIDVRQNPLQVFKEIHQCEHIISSSLHDLIVV